MANSVSLRCGRQHTKIVKPDVRTHAVGMIVALAGDLLRVLLACSDDSCNVSAVITEGRCVGFYFHELLDQIPMNETSAHRVLRQRLEVLVGFRLLGDA